MAKGEGNNVTLRIEDIDMLLRIATDPTKTRSTKQAALNEIRKIERSTGKEIFGNYNGRSVSEIVRNEEESS